MAANHASFVGAERRLVPLGVVVSTIGAHVVLWQLQIARRAVRSNDRTRDAGGDFAGAGPPEADAGREARYDRGG